MLKQRVLLIIQHLIIIKRNMMRQIRKEPFLFSVREMVGDINTRVEVSIFEDNFPAKLDKFFFRINKEDNYLQILELKINSWLTEYLAKDSIYKDLNKFFNLYDLNKDIYYKISNLVDVNNKIALQDIMIEIDRIENNNKLISFIFCKLSSEYDELIRFVEGTYEPDIGDKIDKVQLLSEYKILYDRVNKF